MKWEIDWLLKMQDGDGGVFNRVAGASLTTAPARPAATRNRGDSAKTTWATADAAASLAHAARVYSRFDNAFPGYDDRLRAAARGLVLPRKPWRDDPLRRNRWRFKTCGHAGRQQRKRRSPLRVYAAAELFKTTGDQGFKAYVDRWSPDIAATAENGMHPSRTESRLTHSITWR